jgi:hypothetical protein
LEHLGDYDTDVDHVHDSWQSKAYMGVWRWESM